VREELLTEPDGVLVHPDDRSGTGVLVLAGSSGRIEADRCRLLAALGATALSVRWFGGRGQQPAPFEVPLELFVDALDRLQHRCTRLVVIGTSFGAEAALVLATLDSRVDAVVALAPSPVVWAGVAPDGRQTSHWTWQGLPVPFVPFVPDWRPDDDPPSYRSMFERSLAEQPEAAAAAAIAVEQIPQVLAVGGEDDAVWPGADFARAIGARRAAHGRTTTVLALDGAGHRVRLPGELSVTGGQPMARGGCPEADAALGRLAWPHVVRLLAPQPGPPRGSTR
jgi:dienelactone hydrolase